MKAALTLSLVAVLLTGCHSAYEITLTNGAKFVTNTKPKLVGGLYIYKDSKGNEARISSSRVKVIERQ